MKAQHLSNNIFIWVFPDSTSRLMPPHTLCVTRWIRVQCCSRTLRICEHSHSNLPKRCVRHCVCERHMQVHSVLTPVCLLRHIAVFSSITHTHTHANTCHVQVSSSNRGVWGHRLYLQSRPIINTPHRVNAGSPYVWSSFKHDWIIRAGASQTITLPAEPAHLLRVYVQFLQCTKYYILHFILFNVCVCVCV